MPFIIHILSHYLSEWTKDVYLHCSEPTLYPVNWIPVVHCSSWLLFIFLHSVDVAEGMVVGLARHCLLFWTSTDPGCGHGIFFFSRFGPACPPLDLVDTLCLVALVIEQSVLLAAPSAELSVACFSPFAQVCTKCLLSPPAICCVEGPMCYQASARLLLPRVLCWHI